MLVIYVAIALFSIIIIWLAFQPKQGTKASNAPKPADCSHQLPKPQELPDRHVDPLTRGQSPVSGSTSAVVETFDIDRHDINDRVRLFMQQGQKVEAKLIKTVTNWNLKEVKDYIDRYPDISPLPTPESDGPVSAKIRQLLSERNYMDAIQLVQSRTGMMSMAAKDYIEQHFDYTFPF